MVLCSLEVEDVGMGRVQSSVTGLAVRASVVETGGVRVTKMVVMEVSGSIKGKISLERLAPRGSLQTIQLIIN